jgi:heat shock protein HtpX
MAQLIYFAISRKREYLADASSALYTRYPEGLASALEKLAASTHQLKSANKATAPMYIINPFRHKGMAASDLSSTHPPISERIRILRSMSGASWGDYNQAYSQVRSAKEDVIPSALAASTGEVSLREAKPGTVMDDPDELYLVRETSDLLWNMNKYKEIDCECGTRLRVPPRFKAAKVRCPHCGRIHTL